MRLRQLRRPLREPLMAQVNAVEEADGQCGRPQRGRRAQGINKLHYRCIILDSRNLAGNTITAERPTASRPGPSVPGVRASPAHQETDPTTYCASTYKPCSDPPSMS